LDRWIRICFKILEKFSLASVSIFSAAVYAICIISSKNCFNKYRSGFQTACRFTVCRNLKGAAKFFRQDEILQFFYRNLLGCAAKNFWSLLGCREPKSLKTTEIPCKAGLGKMGYLIEICYRSVEPSAWDIDLKFWGDV
jgi:hypothetical protein